MILYYILKPLVILLNHTPRKVLHGMAKFMAFCLWHLSKDRHHVAVTNAKILGAKDPYKTARKSFDYTFMAYLDIFYALVTLGPKPGSPEADPRLVYNPIPIQTFPYASLYNHLRSISTHTKSAVLNSALQCFKPILYLFFVAGFHHRQHQ